MKKTFLSTAILILLLALGTISAQTVKIGPRLTGNMNIYNQDGLTGTYSGIGIGIGGAIDFSIPL